MNFIKTVDLDLDEEKDKNNCELLHAAVASGEDNSLLQTDDNYDYFILNNPARVSIYKIITIQQTKIQTSRDR